VKLTSQIFAALMLLAWLWAGAHLVLEHGGEALGVHLGEDMHHDHHDDDHHHDDCPAPQDEDEHHHDLAATNAGPLVKSSEQQVFAPQWVPLFERLTAELVALLRGIDLEHEHSVIGDSPPDERAFGWLFVVQTARPVRGPSLVA
jgi:hypothetical protein